MMQFSQFLINWFHINKRNLPWRDDPIPYNVWLSEIILQQTRVNQGMGYYVRFLEAFPTVYDLAKANQQEVLKLWQGLGYYSRARNLHKAAKFIVDDLEGKFPDNYKALIKLPGVGPYTAAAIASIAFNEAVPAIDGNAKRVFSRLFEIDTPIDQPDTLKKIEHEAKQLIDLKSPGDFNQAVMELGATVCLPKKPDCAVCPVAAFCIYYKSGSQHKLPVKIRKVKVRNRYFNYFIFKYNGKTALLERTGNDIWKGLNEFPLYESEKEMDGEDLIGLAIKRWGVNSESIKKVSFSDPIKHVLTHQRIYAKFIIMDLTSMPKKIKLDTNLNTISDKAVSRLTDIFLSMDEKFL